MPNTDPTALTLPPVYIPGGEYDAETAEGTAEDVQRRIERLLQAFRDLGNIVADRVPAQGLDVEGMIAGMRDVISDCLTYPLNRLAKELREEEGALPDPNAEHYLSASQLGLNSATAFPLIDRINRIYARGIKVPACLKLAGEA